MTVLGSIVREARARAEIRKALNNLRKTETERKANV